MKKKRFGIAAGFTLAAALSLPAAAVDFTYAGPDCAITYRYRPETGTLRDLQVVYNGGFAFYPAYDGGIRLVDLGGKFLRPQDNLHTTTLLEERFDGGAFIARFRWSANGVSLDFTVRLRLEGKTLAIEFAAERGTGAVLEFGAGRTEGTPNPRVIDLPYGHAVLLTNGVFVSAVPVVSGSASSGVWPQKSLYTETSAAFGFSAYYGLLSNGRRNALRETFRLAVSPNVADTFVLPANPVSAYRAELKNRVVLDLWRTSFAEATADVAALAACGFRDLFVILHEWQKYGYDNGLPSVLPAGDGYGGDGELRALSELVRRNGGLFALHTNYIDFYPNSEVWNPADVALDAQGNPVKGWFNPVVPVQSYLLKPSRARAYATGVEADIHSAYGTTAAFLDVHTAILPGFKVDFDARAPGAGRQSETLLRYRDLVAFTRSMHSGPVAGEGLGFSLSTWAGHLDAVEADPRSYFDYAFGRPASRIALIPDYYLRGIRPLLVPHGAGYLERFASKPGPLFSQEDIEAYRATTIGFGNAGFLSNPFGKGLDFVETLRDYCFVKHLQTLYLDASPVAVRYNVRGAVLPLSDALRLVVPAAGFDDVDDVLREELGCIRIDYDNGLKLWVNRTSSRTWDVMRNGAVFSLPPSGFLAFKGYEFTAYTALIDGRKEYYLWPAEAPCRGHLDFAIPEPLDFGGVKTENRSFFGREDVVRLAWRPNPAGPGAAKFLIYLVDGGARRLLGEVAGSTSSFLHRGIDKSRTYMYIIKTVNAEGREGRETGTTVL
jgi:hypothetical protein